MKKLSLISLLLLFCLAAFTQYPGQFDTKQKVKPGVRYKALAFELSDVKILDGPFKNAMEKNLAYLLAVEPNRLLHRFHINAGLPAKGDVYGGWESEGLSGHTLGHYLSAISMAYANTGNNEFKSRTDYIVDELERCQQARKTGYVGAIPDEDSIFNKVSQGVIKSGGFDLNGGWSPWYTVHKVMAGLVDAYLYANNDKALKIVCGMADWTGTIVNNLSEEQRLKMLNCEYGGMNEVLVNIYVLTGNKKYLDLSYKFHDEFVMGKLAQKIDPMPGKHSNTNVPKAIGAIRRYEFNKSKEDSIIGAFFWETMVHHHSYVIGGNSSYEYCGEADKLNDRLSDNTCETCNTYNMLKLTKHLFCLNPGRELADYYERALYNHILASQNPTDGMMCYFVPLRMGTQKQFSDQVNTFTCCVGSGMENHVKYAESIYFKSDDGGLFVNLFIPSELNWKDKNITVKQETGFPDNDKVTLTFGTAKSSKFPVYIRNPKWAGQGAQIEINGKVTETVINPAGYWMINRTWKNGDKVEITLPMTIHTESMPDNPNRIAFLYGPVVLAAQLGNQIPDPVFGTPVLLTDNRKVNDWIKPISNELLTFQSQGIGKPADLHLKPFYKTYDQYYSVYFDYFTNADWDARKSEYEADKKRQQEIEERTIDNFRIGEMQPERDHNLQASERSYVSDALGRMGREARAENHFTFEMKVLQGIPNSLLLTYIGDDKNRKFDILVDGANLVTVLWEGGKTGKFYDQEYPITEDLIRNKSKITVSIKASYGQTAGRVFGCRTIKTGIPGNNAEVTPHNDYPIQPVPFTSVKVSDKFWAPRIRLNHDVTIPIALSHCYRTGRVDNFLFAGKLKEGQFCTEYPFDDTDIYKIIEGASYSLQTFPDKNLEARIDSLIYYIGKAQEPDGYLYTNRTIDSTRLHPWAGKKRWEKDPDLSHELYNCGHLYEAAVAHYMATGKRTLLDIAIKNADLLVRDFGPGKLAYEPGHQIVEMGLVKMYRTTGKQEYLDLAKFFLDIRGKGTEYSQDHKKVTDQTEAVGHAVRAMYMYSGMADIAAINGDKDYLNALELIWHDIMKSKFYITGGIGAAGGHEGFGPQYDLPNMSAYNETCASIGEVYWNHRLFLLHGDSKFYDVLERVLYNGLISGVSLSGDYFFYPNPLASNGQHARSAWFGCACCPSNICRYIPSVPGYVYASNKSRLYINLFINSTADIDFNGMNLGIAQKTEYPWDGNIQVTVSPEKVQKFDIAVRIPGWAQNQPVPGDLYSFDSKTKLPVTFMVNGQKVTPVIEKGYAIFNRDWQKGDVISIGFTMNVQRILANDNVGADKGKVALQRGPVVYCVEWPDVKDGHVHNLILDQNSSLQTEFIPEFLGGVTVIKGEGKNTQLVSGKKIPGSPVNITAIPYYAWANRGRGEMAVWLATRPESARPLPVSSIAGKSRATASVDARNLDAIKDQNEPANSNDRENPYFHWWPKRDTVVWIQYEFEKAEKVSTARIYWFDDGPDGGCRVPEWWKLYYMTADGRWQEVDARDPYLAEKDKYNVVNFESVLTKAMKLEVKSPEEFSGGLFEWILE